MGDRARPHQSAHDGLFCAPYALWSLGRGGIHLLRPRALAALCAAGLLGLSPYLYLVSHGGATAAWGSWGYHRSLSGLWTHVTRGEYGTFRLASIDEATNTQTWLRITAYLTSLPGELPAGGPVLAAVGLLRSLALQRLRPLGLLLVCAWLLYIGIFFTLSNLPVDSPFYLQIQQRFWPQPNLYVAAWFALGVRAAVEMVAAPWLALPTVRRWRLARVPPRSPPSPSSIRTRGRTGRRATSRRTRSSFSLGARCSRRSPPRGT